MEPAQPSDALAQASERRGGGTFEENLLATTKSSISVSFGGETDFDDDNEDGKLEGGAGDEESKLEEVAVVERNKQPALHAVVERALQHGEEDEDGHEDGHEQGENSARELWFRWSWKRRFLDGFVTCCNLVNLIMFHAYFNPQASFCASWRQLSFDTACMGKNAPTTVVYTACLWVFTIEAAVNWITAKQGRWFGGNWEAFNGGVVILAWIEFIPARGIPRLALNLRSIDLIRVAKQLNIANGLSTILTTVGKSLRAVIPALCLVLLFVAFFATVALHLFMGTMQQHCFRTVDDGSKYVELDDAKNFPITNRVCGAGYECPSGYRCYIHGVSPANNITYANPKYGLVSYNTIGDSIIQILTSITSSAWGFQASKTVDSVGWTISYVFWVTLIGLGSVFLVKLFLAAVKYEFDVAAEALERKRVRHLWDVSAQASRVRVFRRLNSSLEALEKWKHPVLVRIRLYVKRPHFSNAMLCVVFANLVSLSVYHVNKECRLPPSGDDESCITRAVYMSEGLLFRLNVLEYIYTAIFFGEFVLKLVGTGSAHYFYQWSNVLDAVLVCISLGEFFPAYLGNQALQSSRSLRIFRVFRFRLYWQSLDSLLGSFEKALPRLVASVCLIVAFAYLFATLGMYLYGIGNSTIPRDNHYNFLSFFNSLLNVIQVITGVHWPDIFWLTLHYSESDHQQTSVRDVSTYFYFTILMLMGKYVLFSGFISQLLINLNFGDPAKELKEVQNAVISHARSMYVRTNSNRSLLMRPHSSASMKGFELKPSGGATSGADHSSSRCRGTEELKSIDEGDDRPGGGNMDQTFINTRPSKVLARRARQNKAKRRTAARNEGLLVLRGKTFGVFGPKNVVRMKLAEILSTSTADNIILVLIFGSCLLLVVQSSLHFYTRSERRAARYTDVAFTAMFIVELVAKLIVSGFAKFFNDAWNILDFVVVLSSSFGFIPTGSAKASTSLQALRSIRVLRVLRPLRAIKRLPGLKVSIDALQAAGPVFINVMFIAILCYFVFAIICLHGFAGRFWKCNDADVSHWSECHGYFHSSGQGMVPRKWENLAMNFDNIGNALLTAFQVATRSQYYLPLWSAVDAQQHLGDQPSFNDNRIGSIPFAIYLLTASYLVMTLFIGAIIKEFKAARRKHNGSALLTGEQEQVVRVVRMMLYLRPPMRYSPPPFDSVYLWDRYVRRPCYQLTSRRDFYGGYIFDDVVCLIIVANACVMAAYRFKEDSTSEFWIHTKSFEMTTLSENYQSLILADVFFTCIYLFEAIVKVISHGSLKQYLFFSWNQLDAVIVIIGIIEMSIVGAHNLHHGFGAILIIELARSVRLLKLIRIVPSVRLLGNVLVSTLPAVGNLAMLLTLCVFMFSVIAMNLYGDMDMNEYRKFGTYTYVWNYHTFTSAFLTNLRWALNGGQSDWAAFMHDVMTEHSSAWIYFVVFIVLVPNLLMNLIIAVVLEEFDAVRRMSESKTGVSKTGRAGLTPAAMRTFANVWADIDVKHNMWLSEDQLPRFFEALKAAAPELQIKSFFDVALFTKLKHDGGGIDKYGGYIAPRCLFVDVFVATAIYSFYAAGRCELLNRALLMSMGQTLSMAFRIADAEADTEDGEVAEGCAATIIANVVRHWLKKKRQQTGERDPEEGNPMWRMPVQKALHGGTLRGVEFYVL